jgi:hypothetical protein
MSFRALKRDFDEVVIIDLLPCNERQAWHLSEDLRDWLAEQGVEQFHLSCYSKRHVFEALKWACDRASTTSFILHFTAHGNESGIGLKATKELITWAELTEPLKQLNARMNGDLVINMTACQGFKAVDIQSLDDENDPFYGLVGPTCSPDPELARRCAKQFYKGILDDGDIPKVVQAINDSEGSMVIWCRTHQYLRGSDKLSM